MHESFLKFSFGGQMRTKVEIDTSRLDIPGKERKLSLMHRINGGGGGGESGICGVFDHQLHPHPVDFD
jgi:hypothetical protein